MPNTVPPAPQCNLKLLRFIQKHGGRVTVRQLARSLASCRRPGAAEQILAALVRAGLGTWSHPRPGPKGGRPVRAFALTARPEVLESAMAALASKVRGSRQTRGIAREVVALLNRRPDLSCQQMADALSQLSRILASLAETDQHLGPCHRRIGINARGQIDASWTMGG